MKKINLGLMFSMATIVTFVLSSTALAWDGTVLGKKVVSIELDTKGQFSFVLEGDPVMCVQGGFGNNRRGAVTPGASGATVEGAKQMYSTILSAMLSGKRVNVYANNDYQNIGWGCMVGTIDIVN